MKKEWENNIRHYRRETNWAIVVEYAVNILLFLMLALFFIALFEGIYILFGELAALVDHL